MAGQSLAPSMNDRKCVAAIWTEAKDREVIVETSGPLDT
jgi:hypothetical protein